MWRLGGERIVQATLEAPVELTHLPLRARLVLQSPAPVDDVKAWIAAVSSLRVEAWVSPLAASQAMTLQLPISPAVDVDVDMQTVTYDIVFVPSHASPALPTAPAGMQIAIQVDVTSPPISALADHAGGTPGLHRAETSLSCMDAGGRLLGLYLHNQSAEPLGRWSLRQTVRMEPPLRAHLLCERVVSAPPDGGCTPRALLNIGLTNSGQRAPLHITRLRLLGDVNSVELASHSCSSGESPAPSAERTPVYSTAAHTPAPVRGAACDAHTTPATVQSTALAMVPVTAPTTAPTSVTASGEGASAGVVATGANPLSSRSAIGPWLIEDETPLLLPPDATYAFGAWAAAGERLLLSVGWHAMPDDAAQRSQDDGAPMDTLQALLPLHVSGAAGLDAGGPPFCAIIVCATPRVQLGTPFVATCTITNLSGRAYTALELVIPYGAVTDVASTLDTPPAPAVAAADFATVAHGGASADGDWRTAASILALSDVAPLQSLEPGASATTKLELVAVSLGMLSETLRLRVRETTSGRSFDVDGRVEVCVH